MISAAFISKTHRRKIAVFVLLIFGLFLRLYKINQTFPFDFDQEVPALSAYNFFTNHKLSIVGQELSFQGFFLGPFHNWIQFIPYGICSLKPDCVPYFYFAISLFVILFALFILQKIFGSKIAIISGTILIFSFTQISYERSVNSNYFLLLSAIILLFCIHKYFLHNDKFLIFGSFIGGLATVNFNPIFIFSTIAFILFALVRKNKPKVVFLYSILAFLINYLPLIIFNSRHKNILLNNFLKFLSQNTGTFNFFDKLTFLTKHIVIPFYSSYLFQSANIFFLVFTLFLLFLSFYYIFKERNKIYYFLYFWILIVFCGFIFYKGHIPDYYFQQTLLPFVILIAISLRKNFIFFIIFMTLFLFTNVKSAVNYQTPINYQIKKKVVKFILKDSAHQNFNVYYDMPSGFNTGYDYLFRAFGREPIDKSKNLYVITFNPQLYYKSFLNRQKEIKQFGLVQLISVK